ncbi:MAG: prenyltransferase [Nitrososphaerales archaeon]|nr:prenyltransferase [Nitrososphaerales archaeon]
MDAKTAFISTRPWSFTMTFSSVTLGTLLAALKGSFDPLLYAIVLAGMLAFHAATNVLNDFFDVRHGVDKEGAPTTKYRLHPAAIGQTPLSSILQISIALYGFTILAGSYLAYLKGPSILILLGLGIVGSVLYTADPVVLKARALGEVTVFVMWGLLIPLGAYAVQTGALALSPAITAIPLGALVALVLLANNIRDIEYDGSVQNRTIAVRLGERNAAKVYGGLLAAAYLFVPVGILAGLLPIWSLLVFLTTPDAWRLWKMLQGPVPDNADPRTAGLTLRFALLYMLSFVLLMLVPIHLPF